MTTNAPAIKPTPEEPWQWQTRVLLRSNDGARYEIDRQILTEGSVFFRDLFAVPRPAADTTDASDATEATSDHGDSSKAKLVEKKSSTGTDHALTMDEEIDIDLSFADLTLFADLLQFTVRFSRFGLSSYLQVTLEQAGLLLMLADQYDCPRMRDILRQTVAQISQNKPWEVLVLACDQDDVDLARTAISNLSAKLIHDPTKAGGQTALWDNLSKLCGGWQLEFLRLYVPMTRQYPQENQYQYGGQLPVTAGQLNMDFATWAKNFDPKEW